MDKTTTTGMVVLMLKRGQAIIFSGEKHWTDTLVNKTGIVISLPEQKCSLGREDRRGPFDYLVWVPGFRLNNDCVILSSIQLNHLLKEDLIKII